MSEIKFEEVIPKPEMFIKSIAEQGYTLETALADLMDNSISANANKIEVLTKFYDKKINLFLADNGFGMTEKELAVNMEFPSKSVEARRDENDLGRFGLGMKTASFSQTRKFTVISRKEGSNKYAARTWDVDYLKRTGAWRLQVNSENEIEEILQEYRETSKNHLNQFQDFEPNTIIRWEGLYKFDNYLKSENQLKYFKEQLNKVTYEYLGIVFHNFMENEQNPLKVRLNNKVIEPFNPFISKNKKETARSLGVREMKFDDDILKMEAFVLPVSACDDESQWTTENYNLMDLEGLYIYRGDRIIFYGGWNNIIRRHTRLKLARLKIQVGNLNDVKLQLNVSKSKISIPYELKQGVLRYIAELKKEAIAEYNNRGVRKKSTRTNTPTESLLKKHITTKNISYEVNNEYPLVRLVREDLDNEHNFNLLLRSINILINKQRHSDKEYLEQIEIEDNNEAKNVEKAVKQLLKNGMSSEQVFNLLLKDLGFNKNNLSNNLKNILNFN